MLHVDFNRRTSAFQADDDGSNPLPPPLICLMHVKDIHGYGPNLLFF